jgi:Sulfite exporter TauE/SafE
MLGNSQSSTWKCSHFIVSMLLLSLLDSAQSATFNMACDSDQTCVQYYNSFYKCYSGHCRRENFGWTPAEIFADVLIFLISALANAGGVGGGPMIVPLLISIYKFTPGDAVPVSKITILAGAIMSISGIAFKRHHKDKGSMLINYPLTTFMIPAVLGGTQVGVILTQFLPTTVIGVGMVVFIIYVIFKMREK